MKYTLCIDWKAAYKNSLDYEVMEAKSLEEAMAEADIRWNENVYLMKIMKKDGKTERKNGWRIEKYTATLARRSNGWHLNDSKHCENEHSVRHYIPKDKEYHWFETL